MTQMPLLPDPPVVYTIVLPHWLPPKTVAWLFPDGQMEVTVTLPKAVRNALQMAQRISTSKWAARYRELPTDVAISGKWSNDVTPYLVDIMDVADFPFVRRIVLCKVPQSGGTETAHNIVGKRLDTQPVPVLYNYPDRDTAKENCRDRILPMIKLSPRLAPYLTGLQDDESSLRIKLLTTNIYMAWSGSASRLGNRPIGVLVLDETNKYGQPVKETSAILLARKRLITYERQGKSLEITLSTPTVEKDGAIWDALHKETQVIFDYYVKCPKCEVFHCMTDENLVWEGDEDAHPEDVEHNKLGRYICPKCGDKWDDNRRDMAVRAGQWRDRETGQTLKMVMARRKPGAVGFHLPAWISYFVSLSKSAAAKIRAGMGPKEKQDYVNQ